MSAGTLKPGWKMVKFGDIAENVAVRVDPAEVDTDIYVGLEHLDPDSIHLRQWGNPSDVIGQKLAFKKGDVIFGRRRAYQRKLAVAEFDGICSAHAMVVRAKPEVLLPEFLPFFLQSDMFMDRAIEISVGSLSPTINWKTLRVQEFPLPPLKEQKRLAEILWAADDAVESIANIIIKYKVFYSSLCIDLLDFTNTGKLEKLENVCTNIYRYPTYYGISYVSQGVPEIRGELINPDGTINQTELRYIDEDTAKRFPKTKLERGDLLISVRGTMGKIAVVPKELEGANITANLMRISADTTKIRKDYLAFFILSDLFNRELIKRSESTTIKTIKSTDLKNITLKLPSIEKQSRIVSILRTAKGTGNKLNEHYANTYLTIQKLREQLIGGIHV